MIHHPPFHHATSWHKKLWGIERFLEVIKHHGCELILHGHTHLPTLNIIKGKMGKIPIVGVASAAQAFGDTPPPAGFNFFPLNSLINNGTASCNAIVLLIKIMKWRVPKQLIFNTLKKRNCKSTNNTNIVWFIYL